MTTITVEFETPEQITGEFVATIIQYYPRDETARKALIDKVVAAIAKYLEMEIVGGDNAT
jgi:hypothetical protein